jgi:hypothetical protein
MAGVAAQSGYSSLQVDALKPRPETIPIDGTPDRVLESVKRFRLTRSASQKFKP